MASVDVVRPRFARAPFAVSVPRRRQQIVDHPRSAGKSLRRNERRVAGVDLVPVVGSLHHVSHIATAPEAATIGHEDLTVFVVIKSPLIAATMREDFEDVLRRMIPPDSGAERRALIVG